VLLQFVVAPHVTLMGVHPDLALLVALSWGLLRGPVWGGIFGLGVGVPLDILSGVPVGTFTLGMAVAGFVSGLGEGSLFRTHFLLPPVAVVLGTLLFYLGSLVVMSAMAWPVYWGQTFSRVVAPAMVFNTVLMPFVFVPVRLLHSLTRAEQMAW
jgi:rod shape-determining protein MreD